MKVHSVDARRVLLLDTVYDRVDQLHLNN